MKAWQRGIKAGAAIPEDTAALDLEPAVKDITLRRETELGTDLRGEVIEMARDSEFWRGEVIRRSTTGIYTRL